MVVSSFVRVAHASTVRWAVAHVVVCPLWREKYLLEGRTEVQKKVVNCDRCHGYTTMRPTHHLIVPHSHYRQFFDHWHVRKYSTVHCPCGDVRFTSPTIPAARRREPRSRPSARTPSLIRSSPALELRARRLLVVLSVGITWCVFALLCRCAAPRACYCSIRSIRSGVLWPSSDHQRGAPASTQCASSCCPPSCRY